MNNVTPILILIAAAVLIVVVLGVWFAIRRRRSQKLRKKFGPEYDYTMEKVGDQRTVEETLKEREKRVINLDVRALNENERDRYHGEWMKIQADFVDDPSKSVEEANRLITEVMIARGFPVADFEQRAADLSVMYPDFVSNYRNAYAIALKNQGNAISTEELRQAMVYYHSLFEELLGSMEVNPNEKKVGTQ
jgi:ABC-type multidrug transport system fused ATPase/permease subunit